VQNSIDSVENADPTTIAANLLAVQTRLQASYQTTAAIAKLSLTDYL
jgi:flagellar hook-associated protein 3 FlgL